MCAWRPCECFSRERKQEHQRSFFYFEANLSDGKKCARVVSFDTVHRVILKKAEEEGSVWLYQTPL